MAPIQYFALALLLVITTTSGEIGHVKNFVGKNSQRKNLRTKKLLSKNLVGNNLGNLQSEKYSGSCYSWGNSHYKTLDGLEYTFQGQCSYTLLDAKDESLEPFTITLTTKRDVTKTKTSIEQIDVFVFNTLITLSKSTRPMASVNGLAVHLPVIRAYGDLNVKYIGNYIVLYTNFGLRMRWNANSILMVEVPDTYQGKVSGLCGNYDNNAENEMVTSEGVQVFKAKDFVSGWAVAETECLESVGESPNSCEGKVSVDEFRRVIEFCNILLDETGPFMNADSILATKMFSTCINDTCTEWPKYSCDNVAMLAQISQDYGVEIGEWRSDDFCPMNCPENGKYSLCGNPCPDTCTDFILSDSSISLPCEDTQCVEGCLCEPGHYQSGFGQCVLYTNCGCWTDGYYFRGGDIFTKEAQGLNYLCMRSEKITGIGQWWTVEMEENE